MRMLTKQDLSQITTIVRKETKQIVQTETSMIVQEETRDMKKDIASIRKDIKQIVSFFDREYLELRNRVERIELHLGLQAA